jgi:hypothetical protein
MTGSLRAQHKAQLREAYALIKADRRAEAYELIAPILVQQPNYIDAWWLAAHSAPTLSAAIAACQKVLALKPDHVPAQLMIEELRRRMAVEQHLSADQRPRRVALTRPRPRRFVRRLLVIGVLITLFLALSAVTVAITGETFGLPIAQFFSFEQNLPDLPHLVSDEDILTQTRAMRTGTLPIGAVHRYRLNVHRPNIILWINANFWTAGVIQPRENIRLRLPSGALTPPRDSQNLLPNTITFFLPVQGTYTLELVGTPKAKSFYTLFLAFVDKVTLE